MGQRINYYPFPRKAYKVYTAWSCERFYRWLTTYHPPAGNAVILTSGPFRAVILCCGGRCAVKPVEINTWMSMRRLLSGLVEPFDWVADEINVPFSPGGCGGLVAYGRSFAEALARLYSRHRITVSRLMREAGCSWSSLGGGGR